MGDQISKSPSRTGLQLYHAQHQFKKESHVIKTWEVWVWPNQFRNKIRKGLYSNNLSKAEQAMLAKPRRARQSNQANQQTKQKQAVKKRVKRESREKRASERNKPIKHSLHFILFMVKIVHMAHMNESLRNYFFHG